MFLPSPARDQLKGSEPRYRELKEYAWIQDYKAIIFLDPKQQEEGEVPRPGKSESCRAGHLKGSDFPERQQTAPGNFSGRKPGE